MNDHLANARAIFHERPSEWSWRALCHALDDALELPPHDLDALARYCDGHLSAWPDHLRVAPRRWVARAIEHGPHPLLAICRDVTLPHVGASPDAAPALLTHDTLARATTLRVTGDGLPASPHPGVLLAALAHPAPSVHLDATRAIPYELDEVFDRVPADRIARGGVTLRGHALGSTLARHGAASLSRLVLSDPDTHDLFPALCASPLITELDALDLSALPLDAAAARRLADSRIRPVELRIALAHNPSGDILFDGEHDEHGELATELLVAHDVFARVEHLVVSNLDPRSERTLADALPHLTALTSSFPRALVGAALTSGRALERLTLRGPHGDAIAALDTSRLRRLELDRTRTSPADARALTRAHALDHVAITDDHAALDALAGAPLPNLRALHVAWRGGADDLHDALDRITRQPWFARLEHLTLRRLGARADGARLSAALARADLSSLRALELAGVRLTSQQLRLALTSPTPHLQRLSLDGCVFPDGLAGLGTHHVRHLLDLDIRRAYLPTRDLAARFDRGDLRGLDALRLDGFDDAPALARVLRAAPGLRTLHVHHGVLDASCVEAIRAGAVTDLSLLSSEVDASALTDLLSSREAARLLRLDLSFVTSPGGVLLEDMLPDPGGPLSPRLLARAHVASRRDPHDDSY
jgi:hypothetical protein